MRHDHRTRPGARGGIRDVIGHTIRGGIGCTIRGGIRHRIRGGIGYRIGGGIRGAARGRRPSR